MEQKQEKKAPAQKKNSYFVWCVQQGKKALHEERVQRIYNRRNREE